MDDSNFNTQNQSCFSEADWAVLASELISATLPVLDRDTLAAWKEEGWPALDEGIRNQIDAKIESYRDYQEYERDEGLFSPNSVRMMHEVFPVAVFHQYLTSTILKEMANDPQMLSQDPSTRERHIRKLVSLAQTIGAKPGAVAHRPAVNEDRDRIWSRLRYLGRSCAEIAHQTEYADAEYIGKAVLRHRERRQELQWKLRFAIYQREYSADISKRLSLSWGFV